MKIERGFNLLHPEVREGFQHLADILRPMGFRVFETYRHPARQMEVFAKGTSKVWAFGSPHQFGLAVDFAGFDEISGKWSWDDRLDWDALRVEARRFGLDCPIEWDRGHVEHPWWPLIRQAFNNPIPA